MKNYTEKIENISKLLEERTLVFPVKDASFERLDAALRSFAEELIAEIDFENFTYDESLIEAAVWLSDTPVFICGSMKSGTTLLTHLLDSHPDMLIMPGDSHFYNHRDRWDRTQFNEIAIYWVHRIINPTGQEPFWFFGKEEKVFKTFLMYLHYFLHNTEKEIFVCVVMAFSVLNSMFINPFPKRYWVEKTPHNELHALQLSELFPRAKFIHVLRDPLDNIASLKKLDLYRGWKSSVFSHARVIKKLFRAAYRNVEILGGQIYLVFKYEDLTRDPLSITTQIASFLDIPFSQSLLVPTENDKSAVSNSMFKSDRVQGKILDRSGNSRYLNELKFEELQQIVSTLYPEVIKAGYNWNTKDIIRFKKKGLSYIAHQFMEFFHDTVSCFR